MNYITEPARQTPVVAETEVLVVGGGPAGFGAALHAARMGRKTMLIEQSGAIGGVATTGIMSHWTGRQDGGCFEELRAKARDCESEQVINPEKLRILMLDMLQEAGVEVQLYTAFSDVVMEGSRVTGIITESKSGREAIACRMLIDSTGDGDVAARAGAPFEKGREDGGMQPMTIMFKVAGVDMDRAMFFWGFEDTVQLPEGDLQTLGRRELPQPAGHILLYPASLPGVVTVNMTNVIDVDGTDVRDLNRAEYVCRKQIPEIITFLQRHVPGYEGCYLIDSADVIGVRETRRFEAHYRLTEDDIAEARVFDDWVVTKSNFFFDLHNVEGAGLDANGEYKAFQQPAPYTIPLRSFVPRGIEGLLLNGRNISGTHKAHSSYRVMPIVMNMGHAMGIVAALCIAREKAPLALDLNELHDALRRTNVAP
ncbi:FAD-dependent oxidoreductase [Agathobaculum sp. NTUH-O15-33]|uniref:FAD-dependent oxidoreductase n=1 Tax=Agathobaculum sp. NTUH-O15-33 TaxID=3079302 RepID=UPI00295865F3|nr:FAD-dependent oxidoreductase [Agathobaculum sp. NTUH-O15-33]WNX84320.1 FAD-dependent oxidoreductase [Agathobaculum sp. NTUH-O15-33]